MKARFTIGRKIGFGFGLLILLFTVVFMFTNKTATESKNIDDQINRVLYTVDYCPATTQI